MIDYHGYVMNVFLEMFVSWIKKKYSSSSSLSLHNEQPLSFNYHYINDPNPSTSKGAADTTEL